MIEGFDRCELYDMPKAFCAHCRGHGKTVAEQFEAENVKLRAKLLAIDPRWFPAQRPGVCAKCGTGFSEDSLIRRPDLPGSDGSWIAECCSTP